MNDLDRLANDVCLGKRGAQAPFSAALSQASSISKVAAAAIPLLRGTSLLEVLEALARLGRQGPNEPHVESALRDVLVREQGGRLAPLVCAALGAIATCDTSIEALKGLLASPRSDSRCSALAAIARIGGEAAARVCADALVNSSWADLRGYAAVLVGVNGGADATAGMIAYGRRRLGSRNRDPSSPDELVFIYAFFLRRADPMLLDGAWPSWREDIRRALSGDDARTVAELGGGRDIGDLVPEVRHVWRARRPWHSVSELDQGEVTPSSDTTSELVD